MSTARPVGQDETPTSDRSGLPESPPYGQSARRRLGTLTVVTTPDRWVKVASDAGLGALFLAAIAIQVFALAASWGGASWVPGALAAIVVCGLALARRRERTWTAVTGLVVAALTILIGLLPATRLPTEPGPAMALGLAVLIGSAVRTLAPVRAGAIAGAELLLIVAQLAVGPVSAVPAIAAATWLAGVAAGLALRVLDGRTRTAADRVRRAERLELARELHDIVAHHLTGMLIQSQAAQVVARRNPEKVSESLVEIEAAGSDAMVAMRRVVELLRDTDDTAPTSPQPEGLGEMVRRFGKQHANVRLSSPEDTTDWPPEVTSTVYRIVQEALTNVLRHAPNARSVDVTVDRDTKGVTVEVVDDASPSTARPGHRGGYGLIGMRERVETLGGTLSAGPRPSGAGWSVRTTLPIPTREPR
ncbi:histidine kinase [Amycolatopsis sp. cmx-11-32]